MKAASSAAPALRKTSSMTTKGLSKMKQMTLDMAADPIGESVRQARGVVELSADASRRVQNSFRSGQELLESVTEDNTDIPDSRDVASLVRVAKDANAEEATQLSRLISGRLEVDRVPVKLKVLQLLKSIIATGSTCMVVCCHVMLAEGIEALREYTCEPDPVVRNSFATLFSKIAVIGGKKRKNFWGH